MITTFLFVVASWAQAPTPQTVTTQALVQQMKALPVEQVAQARDALAVLQVNDPYTRIGLQMPMALRASMDRVPAPHEQQLAQQWNKLYADLTAQTSVLASLGVDLQAPKPTDSLYNLDQPWTTDADDLMNAPDPLRVTHKLIDQLPAVAKTIDKATAASLLAQSARIEQATGILRPCPRGPWSVMPGQPWTLDMQLNDWHRQLVTLRPALADSDAGQHADRMMDLLGAYGEVKQASVASAAKDR